MNERSGRPIILLAMLIVGGQATAVPAQQHPERTVRRIDVRVVAVAGSSVYLDQGYEAGLRIGDEVVLRSPGRGTTNVVVQSIARGSSRCVAPPGQPPVEMGATGEAVVPADRFARQEPARIGPARSLPTHPPWTETIEHWDASQPLLAPTPAQLPAERPPQWHGRLFAQYWHTWNRQVGRNQYSLGRIGAAAWLENPFGRGGRLHLDGEFNRRNVFLEDFLADLHSPGRIDRISYRWGDAGEYPWQFEAGRFVSYEFPELGVVDGGELVYRLSNRLRVGMNAGFLPQPFPSLVVGPDFHVSAFARWTSDDLEIVSIGAAFQKTWHHSTPDRDLLILAADFNPTNALSVHAGVWTDFFDHHDTIEPHAAEISQAIVQPVLRLSPGSGIGAHFSYVRWPQLLRRDYVPFLPEQVRDDEVQRYGIYCWHEFGPRLRLDGRVAQWQDQSSSDGSTWEARAVVRDWLWSHGDISVTVFGTNGIYSTGPGGRVQASRRFSWCFASLAYEIADYAFLMGGAGLHGKGQSGITQHAFRFNTDFSIGERRSASIFGDYRFGQGQSAFQAGLFLQQRF